MKPLNSIQTCLVAAALSLVCTTASARRRPYVRPARPVVVVKQPAMTVRAESRTTRSERLSLAVSYLKNNRWLSVGKYASMTGLPLDVAKAELSDFAQDRRSPIVAVAKKKKTVYTLRR